MTARIQTGGLQVAKELYDFINDKAIPGTGIDQSAFWADFDELVHDLAPKNKALLEKRDEIQAKVDAYHRENQKLYFASYKSFVQEIGYLLPEGEAFASTTVNVEPEIANMAGSQLVVTVRIARLALNAAMALSGQLYDAV